MKLIDKDALVAEIEKRKSELQSRIAELGTFESNTLGLLQDVDLYDEILSFIDSLEVKEVDLEKEIQNIIHKRFHDYYGIVNSDTGEFAKVEDMVQIAKHFFELGMSVSNKVQKEE